MGNLPKQRQNLPKRGGSIPPLARDRRLARQSRKAKGHQIMSDLTRQQIADLRQGLQKGFPGAMQLTMFLTEQRF
jgi:hypothetical protein